MNSLSESYYNLLSPLLIDAISIDEGSTDGLRGLLNKIRPMMPVDEIEDRASIKAFTSRLFFRFVDLLMTEEFKENVHYFKTLQPRNYSNLQEFTVLMSRLSGISLMNWWKTNEQYIFSYKWY